MQRTVKLDSHGRLNGRLGTEQKLHSFKTTESCPCERSGQCQLGD